MCGYLHYADNTHRKIRDMFLVHNAIFKMFIFYLEWIYSAMASPFPNVNKPDAAGQLIAADQAGALQAATASSGHGQKNSQVPK